MRRLLLVLAIAAVAVAVLALGAGTTFADTTDSVSQHACDNNKNSSVRSSGSQSPVGSGVSFASNGTVTSKGIECSVTAPAQFTSPPPPPPAP